MLQTHQEQVVTAASANSSIAQDDNLIRGMLQPLPPIKKSRAKYNAHSDRTLQDIWGY